MSTRAADPLFPDDDPLWYKDAVIYQLHVRAFADSSGDGIGDFRGLTGKLDYLQDLGVTALWLLPFYPSPLKDDGYDIADYTSVNPSYGTLADFQAFLREAHRRGLRVITELVLNHTSDQHPWFQRARHAEPGSPLRDFYVWSDTAERWPEARIIFKDFETSNWAWDPVARAYYWHRFYSHQPDLNFRNPAVHEAMFAAMDFWLGMGVDAMRLDAVPYLYERDGTTGENLPETHEFLKALRRHIDERFPGRMLLAEANQWPEDAVHYFGAGDECHMAFHFPLMPRMFMALRMEDRLPIVDIMDQTPAIPETTQWAIFLRNHDELTLEMVTDEERDYMVRVYARDERARINLGIRRRLAPLLENNRRRIELLNSLLFAMPGTPVIYYGDEIGMGDNIYLGDRNGVRTPMQWSADRNAGFSRANPQQLYQPIIIDPEYNYETVNVEAQQNNPSSLLWWMKRLIAQRKQHRALGRGSLEFLAPSNGKILAFLRRYQDEVILVVANLSRHVQWTEMDLSAYAGAAPVELFGRNSLPPIGTAPYSFTLGPHSFYFFALERPTSADRPALSGTVPTLTLPDGWEALFGARTDRTLERLLSAYVQRRFRSFSRSISAAGIRDVIPIRNGADTRYLVLVRLEYIEGEPETLATLLAHATDEEASVLKPETIVARLRGGSSGVLHDGLETGPALDAWLRLMAEDTEFKGASGRLVASAEETLDPGLTPVLTEARSKSLSVAYGDRFQLVWHRRFDDGPSCDLEVSQFLAATPFATHIQPLAGYLEYQPQEGSAVCCAVLRRQEPGAATAWQHALDSLGHFFERAVATPPDKVGHLMEQRSPLDLIDQEPPEAIRHLIATYLESARLLGQRTAEMHLALATTTDLPAFQPQRTALGSARSTYQSLRNLSGRVFANLRRLGNDSPEPLHTLWQQVLDQESAILDRYKKLLTYHPAAERVRIHGNFHLQQLLYTGRDFLVANFDGDLNRSPSDRRMRRSPLRDVAGMLHSLGAATQAALHGTESGVVVRPADVEALKPWAHLWWSWVGGQFLSAYFATANSAAFLPATRADALLLLDAYLIMVTIYRMGQVIDSSPDRLALALRGLLELLKN